MIALSPILLAMIIVLAMTSLGPGMLLLRRARVAPAERLVLAIGLSLFMVYCAASAIFVAHLNNGWYWSISVAGAIATFAARRDIAGLMRRRVVRRLCAHYVLLAGWFLLVSLAIRNLAGGNWCVDWMEHYERAIFFLNHLWYDYRFLNMYLLPARPPMMNLLSTQLLAQVGVGFEKHQLAFVLLNTLCVLPCHLMARRFGGRRYRPWVVSGALALSPMVVQNATFGWAKMLTVFYVLTGIWFYLRGWERRSGIRMIAAFAMLAIGILVHYSAAPYAAVIGLHFVVVVLRRMPNPGVLLAKVAIACALILATWFGWSIPVYRSQAFTSNTTMADSAKLTTLQNAGKLASNLYRTIIPHFISVPKSEYEGLLGQPTAYGRLRDHAFTMYQNELITSAGLIGGILVIVLLCRLLPRSRHPGFWIYFIITCTFLGAAVQGNREVVGVAHVTLQTLTFLALAFLAGGAAGEKVWFRRLFVVGVLIDLIFGVLLNLYCNSRTFQLSMQSGSYQIVLDRNTMSGVALANYAEKLRTKWVFISDYLPANAQVMAFSAIFLVGLGWFAVLIRDIFTDGRGSTFDQATSDKRVMR